MKILVYDNGLNTELAIMLARLGHDVGYCTPWTEAFPRSHKAYIGFGLEGLERVESFTKALERVEYVVCPDTFSQDRVEQARQFMSKVYPGRNRVWGAGANERLEQDRIYMKKEAARVGIPLGPYKEFHGITKLFDYLRTAKDKWVKTSRWRQIETFHHVDWDTTWVQWVGPLLAEHGAVAEEIDFVVEDSVDGVEIGADCLFTPDGFVGGYGYEAKDEAYIGRIGPLPRIVDDVNKKLEILLEDCRSFVSTEVRGGKFLEPTIRCPHPPTAGMMEMYRNLGQFMLGTNMHLIHRSKYCAVLVVRSSWAGDHWTQIEIETHSRLWTKLSQACRINDRLYAVPGNEFVGYVVGLGQTAKAACDACKTNLSGVSCRDMDVNPSALDKLLDDTIVEGRKVGIEF